MTDIPRIGGVIDLGAVKAAASKPERDESNPLTITQVEADAFNMVISGAVQNMVGLVRVMYKGDLHVVAARIKEEGDEVSIAPLAILIPVTNSIMADLALIDTEEAETDAGPSPLQVVDP